MKSLKLYPVLFMLLFGSACMTAGPDSISDVHTQTFAGRSEEFVAARSITGVVYAQAYAGTRAGRPIYGLNIRRNGGYSKFARYNSAFSYGQQLPFIPGDSRVLTCAVIGCDVVEHGQVVLSPAQFNAARSQGMQLRLVGAGDTTVIDVPAEAFNQAVANIPQ